MAEPTIRVKLVPDTSAISGGIGAGMAGTPAGISPVSGAGQEAQKKSASMITIPITDVLSGILKGINKMAEASPMMAASLKLLKKGVDMALMPIADIFANLIRPMAMILIRFFAPLMASYYAKKEEGQGGVEALFGALKDQIAATPMLAIQAGLVLGGLFIGTLGLAATGAALFSWILGMVGTGGGITAVTAGGATLLGLPVALILGTLAFGGIFGGLMGGKSGAIVGALAGILGLGLVIATGATGLLALAIPVSFVIASVVGWSVMEDHIKNALKGLKSGLHLGEAWEGLKSGFGFESNGDLMGSQEEGVETVEKQSEAYTDLEGNVVDIVSAEEWLNSAQGNLNVTTDVGSNSTMMFGGVLNTTVPLVDKFTTSIKSATTAMRDFINWYNSLPLSMKRAMSAETAAAVWAGADMSGSPRSGGGGYSDMAAIYSQRDEGESIGDLYKRLGLVTGTGGA